jgi:hypothetical protein
VSLLVSLFSYTFVLSFLSSLCRLSVLLPPLLHQESALKLPPKASTASLLSSKTPSSRSAIVALDEASKAATVAATVEDNAEEEGFDAHLEDTFEGINWSCLQRYMKLLASLLKGQ